MGGLWVAAALSALVLLLLLIFILENGQRVSISYFGAHGHLPLGVALLLAAVLGALLVVIPAPGESSSCGLPPAATGASTPRLRQARQSRLRIRGHLPLAEANPEAFAAGVDSGSASSACSTLRARLTRSSGVIRTSTISYHEETMLARHAHDREEPEDRRRMVDSNGDSNSSKQRLASTGISTTLRLYVVCQRGLREA